MWADAQPVHLGQHRDEVCPPCASYRREHPPASLARMRMEEEFGGRQMEIIEDFVREIIDQVAQAAEDPRLREEDGY